MIKKTLSIIFALAIFCISCSIPFTYAEDTTTEEITNYYYYGDNSDENMAKINLGLQETRNRITSNGYSYVEDYIVFLYDSGGQLQTVTMQYTEVPTFTLNQSYDNQYDCENVYHRGIYNHYLNTQVETRYEQTNGVSYYILEDSVKFVVGSGSYSNILLVVSSIELEGFESKSSGIDVSFSPALTLDMNKSLYASGPVDTTNLPSNYFTMTITNNFSYAVDVRMYIVEKGESYSLGDESYGPTTTGWDNYNWNVKYLYVKNDWVYSPDISTETGKQIVQYKATSWHLIGKGETLQQTFSWAQINVQEGMEYDVVIDYAVSYDEYYASSLNDDYRECYRNTFSLYKRTIPYNEECTDFGIKPIKNYDDFLTLDNYVGGYVDEDGQIQMNESFNSRNFNDLSGGSSALYSGDNFSITSLTSSTYSVLNFFKYVLEFFPTPIWNAFYFLIAVGVVFGFIKLLKG